MSQFMRRLRDSHILVTGVTQSGKTTWAKKYIKGWHGPALFVNTQGENVPGLKADKKDSLQAVKNALQQSQLINYLPSEVDKQAIKEIEVLLLEIKDVATAKKPLLVVVDESYVYAPQGAGYSPIYRIARRGLGHNVHGLFITQRPQDLSKIVVSQCNYHIIFDSNFSGPYFRQYGLPGDDIAARLQGKKYNYVIWDGKSIHGPFKDG